MGQHAVKQAREGTDVSLSPSQQHFDSFLATDNRFWAQLVRMPASPTPEKRGMAMDTIRRAARRQMNTPKETR